MPDFDVIAIGGGTGGLTVAIGGTLFGLRVALVERLRTGGECTWTGCVPSKALLHVADVAAAARLAAEWTADNGAPPVKIDFAKAIAHVRQARERIGAEETPEALEAKGITVLRGEARLRPGRIVEVDGRAYSARHVVIATGSDPEIPPIPGLKDVHYFTNETVFDQIETLPARLGVIGGGPIGCEMAQAFARLGSAVTLYQSRDRLLPNDDESVAAPARAALERDGVVVHTNAKVMGVRAAPDGGATISVEGQEDLEVDAVLVAAGRKARAHGFGLEECGVRLGKNGVAVDDFLQTSQKGIWALGDVVDPYRFTHVAEMQGRVIVRNILFPWKKGRVTYRYVPWATFIDPEVAHVGMTEAQARNAYGDKATVVTLPLSKVDRAVTEGATDGFVKYVLRGPHILGAHVVAPCAGELIQVIALAMRGHVPVGALTMVTVYPTYVYALHQAADRALMQHLGKGGFGRVLLPLLRRLALAG